VFEDVFLPKLHVIAFVLADHDVEFAAGIDKYSGSVNALNPFQQGRTTRAGAVG
jgi:hypothetical protein